MALRDWFASARGLVLLTREVRRLAVAVERIADHMEGVPRAGEEPSIDLIHTDDEELARIYAAEQRFGRGNGEFPPETPGS